MPSTSAMKRHASIFQRSDGFLVHADSQTTDGVWLAGDPFLKLSLDSDDSALGEALHAALNASRTGIPHPTTWEGSLKRYVKAAGFRSWSALVEGASYVSVYQHGGLIQITPTTNQGPRRGFAHNPDGLVEIDAAETSAAIGAAVRRGLAASIGSPDGTP